MYTDLAKYLSMQDNIAISRNHDNNNKKSIILIRSLMFIKDTTVTSNHLLLIKTLNSNDASYQN